MANYPNTIATWSDVTDGVSYPLATHVNQPNNEVIAVQTELGVLVKGSSSDLAARLTKSMSDAGYLDFATATTLTIASGSVTPTQNYHLIDTEGTTDTDDLDTIVATSTDIRARVLFIRPAHTDRTIVIKHNTGNIYTATALDVTLDETYKYAILIYDSALARWLCTGVIASASSSVAGIVQLATAAEITTGTEASKVITPDALAGSLLGKVGASALIQAGVITTGDGKLYIPVPSRLAGYNLTGCWATVITPSSSGTPTFMLARGRQASSTDAHTFNDMLTTAITIDVGEYSSSDATTPPVISGTYDDMAAGDLIRVDCDVAGTSTANAYIMLEFQLP